jgi:hypothetical protein
MVELRGDLDLAQKAVRSDGFRQLRQQELDRDFAVVSDVVGEVDRRHTAAPDLALDAIPSRHRRTQPRGIDRVVHHSVELDEANPKDIARVVDSTAGSAKKERMLE